MSVSVVPGVTQVLIYGPGGFGREVAWLLRAVAAERGSWSLRTVGYVQDHDDGAHVDLLPGELPDAPGTRVLTLEQAAREFPAARCVVAVGNPRVRAHLATRALRAGLRPFDPLIHPTADYDRASVTIGDGTVICRGSTITVDCEIGQHVQVHVHCTIGHDCRIGDYVTLLPQACVSGGVRIGRGAEIGAHASIRQYLSIGEGATVGMGAVVLKDVPPGETWAGNPARPIRPTSE